MGIKGRRRVGMLMVGAILAITGLQTGVARASTDVSVRDFGARGDGATNDTAAIQRADDAVAAKGGGRVIFPSGTYLAGGIIQDSNVEFSGQPGAVLKHPDGVSSSIIRSRRSNTTGTIAAGSRALRVASASRLKAGTPIAIRGAGVTTSGQTTASPYLYAIVSSVSGKDVTIDTAPTVSVTNATVYVGSMNAAIRNLEIDGNRPRSGNTDGYAIPVELMLARSAVVSNCVIRNGLNGAVMLDTGSTESVVENNTLMDNGAPEKHIGSAVWIFRGSTKNVVRNNTIGGTSYWGVVMDDRTQTISDWDGSSNGNTVEGNKIDIAPVDWNVGIFVIGSNGNAIRNNVLSHEQTGIAINRSTQGSPGRGAIDNAVSGNSLSEHGTGIFVSGSANNFASNAISASTKRIVNKGTDNSFN